MPDLTAECIALFRLHGVSDPTGIAAKVLELVDRDKRDRRIYELRGRLGSDALSERFGLSIRSIQVIVKKQARLKRTK